MSKKVIELIRVSTEGQAAEDRAGIPAQRAVNRRTATQHGLEIVKSIEITDVSGTAVLRSPGMQELLRLIESPQIVGVVAKEFSRLMRPENFSDFALLQAFIDSNTVLFLPDGLLDFASENGKLLGGFRALIAGQERREMLRRLHDAKEAMRRAGKHTGGDVSLPCGVGYSKERGWFYTPEIEKVKIIFERILIGQVSYNQIAEELNIPRTSVRVIAANPIYTGYRVYDQKRDPSKAGYVPKPDGRQGGRKKIRRPEDEIIRVRVLEPIISELDFARVQEIMERKRERHWRIRTSRPPDRFTYSGFLLCGDCGELVYTHNNLQREFYVCKSHNPRERKKREQVGLTPCANKYMLREKLEAGIDHVFADVLWKRDFLETVIEEYNEKRRLREPEVHHADLTAKVCALRDKRDRILEAFFDGVISKCERDSRVLAVEKEIAVYEGISLDSAGATEPRPGTDLETVLAFVQPFAEWPFLDRSSKRQLLTGLCPRISIFRYAVKGLDLALPVMNGSSNEDGHPKTAA